jgi:hypothetical protein
VLAILGLGALATLRDLWNALPTMDVVDAAPFIFLAGPFVAGPFVGFLVWGRDK